MVEAECINDVLDRQTESTKSYSSNEDPNECFMEALPLEILIKLLQHASLQDRLSLDLVMHPFRMKECWRDAALRRFKGFILNKKQVHEHVGKSWKQRFLDFHNSYGFVIFRQFLVKLHNSP